MVTWGSNTVHTFGGAPAAPGAAPTAPPAPAAGTSLFGAPAGASPAQAPAAGGFSFGGASPAPSPAGSTGLFGSTSAFAPAPSGGFGFGAAPAAAPTTSLFGTPAAAPGTSLFGSTPTAAPGSSLFGTTPAAAPANAYGQQLPQQQIPAQAALQAHMDAAARQEADRVRSALEALNAAYTGRKMPSSPVDDSKFVCIVYNDMSPEDRQMRWLQGMGTGGALMAPPRPPQLSEQEWKKAVANNPDPQNYTPVALVGAVALQARVSWQQERAQDLEKHTTTLKAANQTLKSRCESIKEQTVYLNQVHATLKKRLLDVMRKVELARCMNQPLQRDEQLAIAKLVNLQKQMEAAKAVLIALHDKSQNMPPPQPVHVTAIPAKEKLLPVLKEHRETIERMTNTAKVDLRDVDLIQNRVVAQVPALK